MRRAAMIGHRAHARRVDEDDQHQHAAAERDVGRGHHLREVLQERQLRDVDRAPRRVRGSVATEAFGQRGGGAGALPAARLREK